jgi:hypothetical protein
MMQIRGGIMFRGRYSVSKGGFRAVARFLPVASLAALLTTSCMDLPRGVDTNPAAREQAEEGSFNAQIRANSARLFAEGREIFRHDTFGSEAFWGGRLGLHRAIAGEHGGGIGPGLTARQALQIGLKVDAGKLPSILVEVMKGGSVGLDRTQTTLELLRADAVVGVKGVFERGNLVSVGITCALCHSSVDDSLLRGIGRRLDGWPNRDLDVGAIIAMAPDLSPYTQLLGTDAATVRRVLMSWGPGKYDAELNVDGKAFRPDGKPAATLLPAAFGLAGVNNHTWGGGWGNVTYWNAYVANLQMHGQGTFFDRRLMNPQQFPVAAKAGSGNKRDTNDLITSKLGALHFYQLAIPAPRPPSGSFDAIAAARGEVVFKGKAQCATCHVPPLFTEPGWNTHPAADIGIDDFQANRSPDRTYRTAPLRGLWSHQKGGFYHDGRFATLMDVVNHYDDVKRLALTAEEKRDLAQYLLSL